jgi:RNA polymerase sigma factor (sigma-70 family)
MIAQSISRRTAPSEFRIARLGPAARADRALGSRLKYIDHPSFDDPTARDAILAPATHTVDNQVSHRLRTFEWDAPLPGGRSVAPILSREQEVHLFRKMNYLKCRASQLEEHLDPDWPSPAELDEIERLKSEALALKNRIVEMNLRLVIFIVKKCIGPGQDLSELVSDGNLALIQAVDRFDFARGNRFSTYATWAIRNALATKAESDGRHRGRPFALYEATLTAPDSGVDEYESQEIRDQRRSSVSRWLAGLGTRERWILACRYGFGGAPERTLAQIGRELGISKQRVSQIAARAHAKIRKIARREALQSSEI